MNRTDEWKKENTIVVAIRLNKHTDADLIAWLDGKESKMGEVKRLMRIAIENEK